MAIGERIRFFRNKKGVTQKYLGQAMGFPERSADVRMAQYETGSRTPKANLTRTLAASKPFGTTGWNFFRSNKKAAISTSFNVKIAAFIFHYFKKEG